MYNNEEEVLFQGGVMITETDLKGRITYVNRKFVDMSAYEKSELVGNVHSIMRHPDMPRCLFKNMWETLKTGETWKGYVKNLRKDGKYYWVVVYVSHKYDDMGTLVGYIAARKVPEHDTLEAIKKEYGEMLDAEQCIQDNEMMPTPTIQNIIGAEMGAVR